MIMIKCVYFALTVFGLIPVLFGLLYEMILLLPIRVPLHHTPVHLLWQVYTVFTQRVLQSIHCLVLILVT